MYEVRFIDGTGVVSRRVQAADVQSVAAVLGVAATNLLSVHEARDTATLRNGWRRQRFPLRLFSQELSVLLGAGIPLLEAIATLREKEVSASVREPLDAAMAGLKVGESFSTALRRSPAAFDDLFIAIVESAERTGQLRDALASHSSYLAWVQNLRDKLVQASIYPAMLVVASLAVMVFLLTVVVPRFAGILDGVGGEIPAASRWLMDAGQWAGEHRLVTVGFALMLLAAPFLIGRMPLVKQQAEELLWRTPGLGERLRLLALARLLRTLGMLLSCGVPAVPAMRIARGVVSSRLRPQVELTEAAVSRGERLSDAFDAHGLSTPVSQRMLRVGEQSGELAAMLGQAAAFYDEELTRFTDVVTRLVNPLLMLGMGGLIGSIIVLLYLPIFQLVEQVQ